MNTCGAIVDCKKEKVYVKFGGDEVPFNISKFTKQHHAKDLPYVDEIEIIDKITVTPSDALEQYLLEHESLSNMQEIR